MMRVRPLLAVLLALTAGCTIERPTEADYLAVLPKVLAFSEADARANAPGRRAEGPLHVDLKSFVGGARLVTKTDVKPEAVRQALGRPAVISVHADSTLLCDQGDMVGGCWVREYGVYVHLNLMRWAPGELTAFVASTTTDRREFPTRICDRVWKVRYERVGTEWKEMERELRKGC